MKSYIFLIVLFAVIATSWARFEYYAVKENKSNFVSVISYI